MFWLHTIISLACSKILGNAGDGLNTSLECPKNYVRDIYQFSIAWEKDSLISKNSFTHPHPLFEPDDLQLNENKRKSRKLDFFLSGYMLLESSLNSLESYFHWKTNSSSIIQSISFVIAIEKKTTQH